MTTSSEQPVILEKIDSIGRITLNRPEVLNAINADLGREFVAALDECGEDDEIRAVLIRGAGRAFCAGDDIGSRSAGPRQRVPTGPQDPSRAARRPAYTRIIREIRGLPKPVVAAIHTYALGAGCDVAMACDFRIVAEGTRFGLVFVKRGLVGGTWLIQQHVGLAKATELLLTGEMFDVAAADQMGLVTKVVAPDKLEEESHAYAAELAKGPTKIMGFIKIALNRSRHEDLDRGYEFQYFAQSMASQTEDAPEGRIAFQERRDTQFKGL